jgi:hypothetical protein
MDSPRATGWVRVPEPPKPQPKDPSKLPFGLGDAARERRSAGEEPAPQQVPHAWLERVQQSTLQQAARRQLDRDVKHLAGAAPHVPREQAEQAFCRRAVHAVRSKEMVAREAHEQAAWAAPGVALALEMARMHAASHAGDTGADEAAALGPLSQSLASLEALGGPDACFVGSKAASTALLSSMKLRAVAEQVLQLPGSFRVGIQQQEGSAGATGPAGRPDRPKGDELDAWKARDQSFRRDDVLFLHSPLGAPAHLSTPATLHALLRQHWAPGAEATAAASGASRGRGRVFPLSGRPPGPAGAAAAGALSETPLLPVHCSDWGAHLYLPSCFQINPLPHPPTHTNTLTHAHVPILLSR